MSRQLGIGSRRQIGRAVFGGTGSHGHRANHGGNGVPGPRASLPLQNALLGSYPHARLLVPAALLQPYAGAPVSASQPMIPNSSCAAISATFLPRTIVWYLNRRMGRSGPGPGSRIWLGWGALYTASGYTVLPAITVDPDRTTHRDAN